MNANLTRSNLDSPCPFLPSKRDLYGMLPGRECDVRRRAAEEQAEAILVSQVVTQKNVHVHNLTKLIELAEAEGVRDRYLFVVGGPRISHAFAKELGYDAGFGPGSTATSVASYLAQELIARKQ